MTVWCLAPNMFDCLCLLLACLSVRVLLCFYVGSFASACSLIIWVHGNCAASLKVEPVSKFVSNLSSKCSNAAICFRNPKLWCTAYVSFSNLNTCWNVWKLAPTVKICLLFARVSVCLLDYLFVGLFVWFFLSFFLSFCLAVFLFVACCCLCLFFPFPLPGVARAYMCLCV